MKLALWIAHALLMLFACSVLSAVAIPFGNSFCPIPNSAGEDFSGLGLMVIAGTVTLLAASVIVTLVLRNAWRSNLPTLHTLSKVGIATLVFPLLWLSLSVAYNYKTCPGFGRSLTPEQMEVIRHG